MVHGPAGVVRDAEHVPDGTVQRREEIVPVNGDDGAGLHLVDGLPVEVPDLLLGGLSHGADAQKQQVGTDVIQLSLQIVEAGPDEDGLPAVADEKIVGAALLVVLLPRRLHQGLVDGLPQVVVDDGGLGMY